MSRAILSLCLVLLASNLPAANITIGPNGCSLAGAIMAANSNSPVGNCSSGSGSDFIIAPDGWVVTLTSPLPTITSNLTIRSASAAGLFTIDGDDEHRVLKITGSSTDVTLLRVRLIGGHTEFPENLSGSAILVENATVRLEDSIITANGSNYFNVGGIYVDNGDLTIVGSTVRDNETLGLEADDSAVRIVESTFANNRSELRLRDVSLSLERSLLEARGSAIDARRTTGEVSNSTIQFVVPPEAWKTLNQFAEASVFSFNHVTLDTDIYGLNQFYSSFLSVSNSFFGNCDLYNSSALLLNVNNLFHSPASVNQPNCLGLVPANRGLLPLADNGGPTRTRAIGNPNSEAINAGDPAYCEALDQRGETRGAACDIGSYEVSESANVSVRGSVDPAAPFVSGQRITYYAEVANNGPGQATHVEVDLDIAGAQVTAIDSAFCPAIPCVITSIQAGQTLVVPVEMTLFGYLSGPLSVDLSAHSTANSTYDDADENNPSGSNFHSLSHVINQGADLAITLDLITLGPFSNAQTLEYTALIENLGPQTASGVQLQFVAEGLTGVTYSGCTPVSSELCNVANIASGGSRSVTIQGVVGGDEFNAVGTVSANQIDINSSNNIDNANNGGGVFKADIAVALTLQTAGPYYSYQYLSFDIAIATDDDPASNIQLFYEFPGAELIDIQGCNAFPCVIPSMPANTEIHRLAQFFAPFAIPGVVDMFSLTVLTTPGQQDPDLSNNQVTVAKPLGPSVDVGAQLSLVSTPPFYAGQQVEYALRVPNAGFNTATNVNINMSPQNLTLASAFGNLCQTVDCSITQLNGFDEENITLIYQITQVGSFDLTATTSANEFDSNTGNNTDSSNNGGVALQPPLDDQLFGDGFE